MTDPNNKRHYRQVILDRSKNPRHQGQTNPIDRRERGHNPSCGDTIELTLALNEAGIEIADIKFEGIGCALCLASADFMAGAVKGIRLEEALLLVEQFRQLLIEQAQFSPP